MDSSGRFRRTWQSLHKDAPPTLSAPDSYGADEIAVMLGSLGIAMLEVGQPTNLVLARLMTIASRYTTATVRIAVLPTVLILQIGTVGVKELRVSTR